jgi:hypothetical protein
VIVQFLRVHERFCDDQKRSIQIVAELRQQLSESKELESSAAEVNNLLRRKLEQQKAKLAELTAENGNLQANVEDNHARFAQLEEESGREHAALEQRILALEADLRAARLDAVGSKLQSIRNAPSPSLSPRPQPQPQPVSPNASASSNHNSASTPSTPSTSATVTLAPPATLDSASTAAMHGSALLSQVVNRLWTWATVKPPVASAFSRDLKQRYDVHERRGGKKNSRVFRATDRESNERVALKTIREPADVREVMLLTKMRHRSLVRCDAVAIGSGSVMCAVLAPFVETDLAFAVTSNLVRPAAAPLIMRQLLDALAYMHSGDVAHGNVCPTSILVTSECSVLLASCSYAHSVRSARAPGVPQRIAPWNWHSAPEVLVAEKSATRPQGAQLLACDVWSAGAVALFVLLQRPAFEGQTAAELLQSIAQTTPSSLVAGDAASFCSSLLQIEPASRPLARDAVMHAFIRKDNAALRLDTPDEPDANVCALTYELQDACLLPFANAYAPRLTSLIKQ